MKKNKYSKPKQYITVRKSEYLDWTKHQNRIKILKNYYKSQKFKNLSSRTQQLIEQSIKKISQWKRARTSQTKTKYRKSIKNIFKKVFSLKQDKQTKKWYQTDKSVGMFKTPAGFFGLEQEVIRREKVAERMGYNQINNFDDFKKEYFEKYRKTIEYFDVIAHFDSFVNDTDTGWTRRVMTDLGVSETVSREEFYKWLIQLKS